MASEKLMSNPNDPYHAGTKKRKLPGLRMGHGPTDLADVTCEDDSKPDKLSMALENPKKSTVSQLPLTILPATITSGKP